MAYHVFISHTNSDAYIAKAVTKVLNETFNGAIKFYLAMDNVAGGVKWKEELIQKIQNSDAIICIITPEAIDKPWIYVEWSPFWMENKKWYVLVTDEVRVTDLIDPMRDRQCVDMTKIDQIKEFLYSLFEDSKAEIPSPESNASRFVSEVLSARRTQVQETYEIYRENPDDLPSDDHLKVKIAEYFLQKKDLFTFSEIVRRIRDDDIKIDLALRIFPEVGDDVVYGVIEKVHAADCIGYFAMALIDRGYTDSRLLSMILDNLSVSSQPELRKITLHMLSNSQEESDLFQHVLGLITNMESLKNIVGYLIDNNRIDDEIYGEIIEQINNFTTLKKIGFLFIHANLQMTDQFANLFINLCKKTPINACHLLEDLKKHDPDSFGYYRKLIYDKELITDPSVLSQISDL
ncbi:MAG: toll/interleukin-1 receptor domain-containing protein [Anaerolineaceae bacterium]